jgi:hypothetical protein
MTFRQVIYYYDESHMNCYIPIKYKLTKETPVIKHYMKIFGAALNDN